MKIQVNPYLMMSYKSCLKMVSESDKWILVYSVASMADVLLPKAKMPKIDIKKLFRYWYLRVNPYIGIQKLCVPVSM